MVYVNVIFDELEYNVRRYTQLCTKVYVRFIKMNIFI